MGTQLQMLLCAPSAVAQSYGAVRQGSDCDVCPAVRACGALRAYRTSSSPVRLTKRYRDPSDQLRLLCSVHTQLRLTGGAKKGAAVNGTVIKRKPGETAHCIRVHCLHRGQCCMPCTARVPCVSDQKTQPTMGCRGWPRRPEKGHGEDREEAQLRRGGERPLGAGWGGVGKATPCLGDT